MSKKFQKTKFLFRIIFYTIILLLISVVVFLFSPFFGNHPYVDISNSMSPKILAGDIVINKKIKSTDANINDIVTFQSPSDGKLITHRVISISKDPEKNNYLAFVTKGDANNNSEKWSVKKTGHIGKMNYVIPKAGFIVQYLQKTLIVMYLLIALFIISAIYYLIKVWTGNDNKNIRVIENA